jgi:hypothetical protein
MKAFSDAADLDDLDAFNRLGARAAEIGNDDQGRAAKC